MVFPYPFFAGAALFGPLGPLALAGFACGVAPAGPLGAISALIENVKVWTPVFLSSCLVSFISTFWKYPERLSAVMKFATELIEAAAPSMFTFVPLLVMDVSHRFSARETVLAT